MIREYPHPTTFAANGTHESDTFQHTKPGTRHMDQLGRPQPVIGIPIPVTQGAQGPLLFADAAGAWAVERMLGRVFLIPLWPFPTHTHVYQSLWPLLQAMDGLFLPAGLPESHWYMHWKDHERHPGPQSWSISWEIALAQLATFIGMPILAVADGAEKWNCALGGSKEELSSESVQMPLMTPDTWGRRMIRIRSKSTLASHLQPIVAAQDGKPLPWELAFQPQQAGAQLAPGLRSCAQFDDATLAAFERSDAAFGLAMMGRLDHELNHTYSMTLFDAFLQACKAFDCARQCNRAWEASRDRICATVYERVRQEQPLLFDSLLQEY